MIGNLRAELPIEPFQFKEPIVREWLVHQPGTAFSQAPADPHTSLLQEDGTVQQLSSWSKVEEAGGQVTVKSKLVEGERPVIYAWTLLEVPDGLRTLDFGMRSDGSARVWIGQKLCLDHTDPAHASRPGRRLFKAELKAGNYPVLIEFRPPPSGEISFVLECGYALYGIITCNDKITRQAGVAVRAGPENSESTYATATADNWGEFKMGLLPYVGRTEITASIGNVVGKHSVTRKDCYVKVSIPMSRPYAEPVFEQIEPGFTVAVGVAPDETVYYSLATEKGLLRYNGRRSEPVAGSDSCGFIRKIAANDRSLWGIGGEGIGELMRDGSLEKRFDADVFPTELVIQARIGPEGDLWLLTEEPAEAYRIRSGTEKFEKLDLAFAPSAIHPLPGETWFATAEGDVYRRDDAGQVTQELRFPDCGQVMGIDVGEDEIWILSNESQTRHRRKSGERRTWTRPSPGSIRTRMGVLNDGRTKWVVAGSYLYYAVGDELVLSKQQIHIAGATSRSPNGPLYLAATDGLFKVGREPARLLGHADGLVGRHGWVTLVQQTEEGIYCSGRQMNLSRFRDGRFQRLGFAAYPYPGLHYVRTPSGREFLTPMGIEQRMGKSWSTAHPVFELIDGMPRQVTERGRHKTFLTLYELRDGRLFLGTSKGLLEWDVEAKQFLPSDLLYPLRDRLEMDTTGVTAMLETSDGTIYAGGKLRRGKISLVAKALQNETKHHGQPSVQSEYLLKISGKKVSLGAQEPFGPITALLETAQGEILVGAVGVRRLDSAAGRLIPLGGPLENAAVTDMVSVGGGAVCFSSRGKGVYLFRDGAWSHLWPNEPDGRTNVYDLEYDATNQRIWMGTSLGLASYDLDPLPPKVLSIDSIRQGDDNVSLSGEHSQVRTGETVTTTLAAIDDASGVLYQYRLGSENEWKMATDGVCEWIPYRDGDYTLVFRALDSSLNPSPPLEWQVQSFTPFWQRSSTHWGVAAAGVFSLVAIGTLLALNARSRRKRTAMRTAMLADLSAANLNLQNANASLEEMTYAVAHDLKSPLRNIYQLSEMIGVEIKTTTNTDELLLLMKGRVQRLTNYVEGILTFARAGVSDTGKEVVDMSRFVSELAASLSIPQGISCNYVGSEPAILVDPTLFTQVLQNLIVNATTAITRAGREVGNIEVDCEREGELWRVSVTDDGPGIDPAHQTRIFDLFQTLHDQSDGEEGGTGLGLAIVKKIVKSWNGEILLKSELGEGATFSFTLESTAGNEEISRPVVSTSMS